MEKGSCAHWASPRWALRRWLPANVTCAQINIVSQAPKVLVEALAAFEREVEMVIDNGKLDAEPLGGN